MVKKVRSTKKRSSTKSKTSKRKMHKPHITQTSSEVKVEKILVDNFVSLQKVMTNLSLKFDKLTHQISNLLELFEISAKALAEKDAKHGGKDSTKLIEKIDILMDQNKTIARGLTLMHEKTPGQVPVQKFVPVQKTPQAPAPPQPQTTTQQSMDMEKYQKSISSGNMPDSKPKFKPLPKY
jgi:hypothetical protein